MLLFELLDNPVEWTLTTNKDRQVAYAFTLPDGREIVVNFALLGTFDKNTSFTTDAGVNVWILVFRDNEEPQRDDDGEEVDPFGVTGGGGELIIFATVLEIVADFLQNHPNDVVRFSADEPNRQTLYHRLISRYIKPPIEVVTRNQDSFFIGHKDALANMGLK